MKNLNLQIEELSQELFAYDKSFMEHETEVKQLIGQLLQAKPDTKFNEQFARNLREQLMQKAENLKTTESSGKKFNWQLALWPAMAAIVLVVSGVALNRNQKNSVENIQLLTGKVEIEPTGKNAFGSLSMEPVAFGRGGGGGTESLAVAPTDLGVQTAIPTPDAPMVAASPSIAVAPTSNTRTQSGGGGGNGVDMKIMPPFYNYRYIYKGEDLQLDEKEVNVYRRQKGLSSSTANQFLKQLRFGMVDMTKFNNLNIDSINLMENKEYGYNIMINFRDGIISVNENWELWPSPTKQCQTPECYDSARIKPNEVPADSELIRIADGFLKDYGISTENYGKAQVLDYWRRELAAASDLTQVYIPDIASVVYPLILDGKQVYDEGGSPSGLVVNVNIRAKKASGVQELAVQKYQSSAYEAETDVTKVLKLAESGGFRPIYYAMENSGDKTEDIELGTPTKSLIKIWQYKNGASEELYVPALVFPVISSPKNTPNYGYNYKTNVIIPLAKEILNGDNNGGIVPMMR